jgi:hypothetical protein
MLKEVGASGQISLGKRYAGQLFDMQISADGAMTLTPVKVVPVATAAQEESAVYQIAPAKASGADSAATQAHATREWADAHAAQIDQYNEWVSAREPYSQRVRRWREQIASDSVAAVKT